MIRHTPMRIVSAAADSITNAGGVEVVPNLVFRLNHCEVFSRVR